MGRQMIDLTGQIFGHWKVLQPSHRRGNGAWYWLCQCKCGIRKPVNGQTLRGGLSRQCRKCANLRDAK